MASLEGTFDFEFVAFLHSKCLLKCLRGTGNFFFGMASGVKLMNVLIQLWVYMVC